MHFCCNEWHSHLKNEEDDPTTELLRCGHYSPDFQSNTTHHCPRCTKPLKMKCFDKRNLRRQMHGVIYFPFVWRVSFPFPKILVNQDCNCTNADQKSRHCTCGTGQPPKVENVAAASSQFPRNVAKIYEGQPIWVVGVPFLLDYDF